MLLTEHEMCYERGKHKESLGTHTFKSQKKKKKERKYKAFEWFLFQNEEPRDESMKE